MSRSVCALKGGWGGIKVNITRKSNSDLCHTERVHLSSVQGYILCKTQANFWKHPQCVLCMYVCMCVFLINRLTIGMRAISMHSVVRINISCPSTCNWFFPTHFIMGAKQPNLIRSKLLNSAHDIMVKLNHANITVMWTTKSTTKEYTTDRFSQRKTHLWNNV